MSNKTRTNITKTDKTKTDKIYKTYKTYKTYRTHKHHKTHKPLKIGEGAYGCVYRPSLKCKNKKNVTYKNKVSKIMEQKKAIQEYNKMKFLEKIKGKKKFKFIQKHPIICQPLINKKNSYVIKKCEVFDKEKYNLLIFKDHPEYLHHYTNILIMDDAGMNLYLVVKYLFKHLTTNDKNIFLTKIMTLLEGVKFFIKNKIVHHDIKENNIMYDPYTATIKFIDFGLQKTFNEYLKKSKSSSNIHATSHGNFPPENSCVNKKEFNKNINCHVYKNSENFTYDKFLNKNLNTFDIYSLTFALEKIFNKIKFLDKSYTHFCNNVLMYILPYKQDIFYRSDDLSHLIKKYECLLKKYKIYNTSKKITTPHNKISHIMKKVNNIKSKETKYEISS